MTLDYIKNSASSLLTGWNAASGGWGSQLLDSAKATFDRTYDLTERFHQSVVGNYLINSAAENALECIGAIGGSALATSILLDGVPTNTLTYQVCSVATSQLGAILGGYAAIRFYGNEEKLLNPAEPHNSYTVKSLQASAVCSAIGQIATFHPIEQAIHDQLVGSLAYHSITVFKPLAESLCSGRLLDETLPAAPILSPEEKAILHTKTEDLKSNLVSNHTEMAALVQDIAQSPLMTSFIQEIKRHSQDQIDEQELITVVIQSMNAFFILLQEPAIQSAEHQLVQSFLDWQKASSQDKLMCEQLMLQKQADLIAVLQQQMMQQPDYAILQEQGLDSVLKEMISKPLEDTVNQFMLSLEKLELKLFAFPLTNMDLKRFIDLQAKAHVEYFSFSCACQLLQMNPGMGEETIRQTYQRLNHLLANYYSLAVEARLPYALARPTQKIIHHVEEIFDGQLRTAQLRPAHLGDFVELTP